MRTVELVLPRLHPAQRDIKRGAARFNVLACGRRFGKTMLGHDLAVHPLLKGQPVGWFAPTYKVLIEAWQAIVRLLHPVARRVSEQDKRIELVTGGVFEAWSLDNPDAGRSRKYARVLIDEAGLMLKLLAAWQEAIRPTLTDLSGDAFILGTPKGRNGFWQLFQRGMDDARGEWCSWQLPTSANPYIAAAEIEAARRELPERVFQQEYLAQFLDSSGGVFRRIQEAVRVEVSRVDIGRTYIGGVDWGRVNDFTVLMLLDAATREVVEIDRFGQIDYAVQLDRFRAMHDKYRVTAWVAEQNSMGMPLVEQLQREGYPVQAFTTTNASKTQIIDALALAFERGDIGIPDDPMLISELLAYEMERLPSGASRYSAPEGMHDDMVMALALAWHGIGNSGVLRRSRRAA